jgi:hypothetical protein
MASLPKGIHRLMSQELTVQRSKELAEKASAVADRVQILEIRLLESRTEQRGFDEDPPSRIVTKIHVETNADVENNRIEVVPHFFLMVKRQNASPEDYFVRIEARFAISYILNSSENLSQENYDAFGERNGVFNVWPYWREFVQSTTVRMGLPPLTVPVFRVGAAKLEQDSSLPKSKSVKRLSANKERAE